MSTQTGHDDAKPQTVLESLIRRWRQRPDWSEGERQVVVADLMPEGDERRRYLARFVTLSVLSTVLASFGLISNSIATLIAGMLLDPLMTPVLAVAASMVFGQPTRVLRALSIVGGGTLVAIATGWLVAAISPGFASTDDLTSELLLRTSPSLLDLGVAVAAGVSAGYVLTHREANSVIPGVAIAVALVPPLAAVGVLLVSARPMRLGVRSCSTRPTSAPSSWLRRRCCSCPVSFPATSGADHVDPCVPVSRSRP